MAAKPIVGSITELVHLSDADFVKCVGCTARQVASTKLVASEKIRNAAARPDDIATALSLDLAFTQRAVIRIEAAVQAGQCRRFRTTQKTYRRRFRPVLAALEAAAASGSRASPDEIARSSGLTVKEVATAIDKILAVDPGLFRATDEYMPKTPTMIRLIEDQIGPIGPSSFAAANQLCTRIIDGAIESRYSSFVSTELAQYLDATKTRVDIPRADLLTFLRAAFRDFVTAQDNGLVSRAGGYNEAILRRALLNGGLAEPDGFQKTGTKNKGDFAFYCNRTTPREILYAEVKSYAARERLLRGLNDVSTPKIGIGFFTNPSEFNQRRTQSYLDTLALAIYVPDATLVRIDQLSRDRRNSRGNDFYRPLSQLVDDIIEFSRRGVVSF